MKIKNIKGLSSTQLQQEVEKGGKFIYYAYTVSFIIVTFRRVSGVYLVRGNESAVKKGLPFTMLSFFLGWWGIPFGPKHTFESIRINLKGGRDVTNDVMAVISGYQLFRETQKQKTA